MAQTSTSLSLRALLKTAIRRSGMDQPAPQLSGLTAPAKALSVAGLAHAFPQAAVLYVVPGDGELEQVVGDVKFFLTALEGLTAAAAAAAVLPFPPTEVDPYRGLTPHIGVTSARARALYGLASGTARIVVASAAAVLPRVSTPGRLAGLALSIKPGDEISLPDLTELLVDAGFTRQDPADQPGEFALRGGILDFYPVGEERPVRLEFVGDMVESLRWYDPASQRSIAPTDQVVIVPLRDVLTTGGPQGSSRRSGSQAEADIGSRGGAFDRGATIFDYLAGHHEALAVVSERDEVEARLAKLADQLQHSFEEAEVRGEQPVPLSELFTDWEGVSARLAMATALAELGVDEAPAQQDEADEASSETPGPADARGHVRCQPAMAFHGRFSDWIAEIRRLRDQGDTILFVAATAGRAERTIELLKDHEIFAIPIERAEDARYAAVLVALGTLSRGFRLPASSLQIYAESDVFEEERRTAERRRSATTAFLSDLRDLKAGDLVVHVDHGIGMFVGLRQIGVGTAGDAVQEFLEMRYAGEDKLFVPVERLDLVQKYTGATRPPLDRLGGTSWERAKTRVKKAMRDMAEELLKLYAQRRAVPGHAFSPDSHWQQEFEDAFEYELTADQQSAITDIKRDMEAPAPMDRLLCGDVGYGKTEVAMRAAFKAVMDGQQVAFLAPTTVLAFQHEKTLKERFATFPVRIEMISRFRSKVEQKAVLADLAAGKVEVIVGTHRLLSKDVEFRDLGLLVVDEEQRFGVVHKERIKQLKKRVDVLTMSATPIPRTLNMSLVGIRDMSIIETPPKDRLSIQTNVVKFDAQVIQRAITSELARAGQVYFVHDRVESIFSIGDLLRRLVPEARIAVAHGQMGEDILERAMLDFINRRFDILLATTIIENGLDIPNVNTIIINHADRYGLSQLYQLRGRVGRSDRPAYAYLLIPADDALSPVAKKRLAAIKEFSDLGSGFRVAALDLEIRGAGNLLGGEQSGHIEAVGFEMYMKLLEETVRELKGEEIDDDVRATINLHVDLRIDDTYVPDMNQRLMLYRKIAAARSEAELDRVLDEVADRYGPVPDSVLNLFDYGRLRVMADRLGLDSVDREGATVVLKFRPQAKVDPVRLVALVRQRSDLTLVPPAALRLELGTRTPSRSERPASGGSGAERRRRPARGRGTETLDAPSWWTARARTGAVEPGFSKEAMLHSVPDDPRAPGGIFEQVGELLGELIE